MNVCLMHVVNPLSFCARPSARQQLQRYRQMSIGWTHVSSLNIIKIALRFSNNSRSPDQFMLVVRMNTTPSRSTWIHNENRWLIETYETKTTIN